METSTLSLKLTNKEYNLLHKKENPINFRALIILISTFIAMIGAGYLVYILQNDFAKFNFERLNTKLGFTFFTIFTTLFVFKVITFIYDIYLYSKYKPIESVSDEKLPTITVIVPAYNEGKQVWETLKSLAKSDYPKDKLQLLSIDDGSKDDTWHWMQEAKKFLGDQVTIMQQPKNMGKRHALYRGFNMGTGEVFVTVDSDSIVTKKTLRNLVSPLVTDKNCGAVAGNIQVLNNKKALIPKMLNVSFVMSFEFKRSAESSLNSVLCTPGALAAYRATSVFNCLEEWIDQKFMGKTNDIGEDRALTNMILKQGQSILFQRNAYAYTNVPEDYKGLSKMFIRWSRSNVRENISMAKFVFTNYKKENKFGARLLYFSQAVTILMAYPIVLFMLYFIFTHPILFVSSTLFSILIFSSFPVLFYSNRYNFKDAIWAYSYSILFTFGLFWIVPYSITTVGKGGWLTREIPA